MKAFLDLDGLTTFWALVKQYIDTSTSAAQVEMQVVSTLPTTGTQGVIYLIANSESTEDENVYDEYVYVSDTDEWEKLGAFFSLPVATATTLGGVMVGTSLSISNTGVLSVKAATTSQAGTMSASDKSKLDGIASGAEVNQNAFSNVVVGSTTLAADTTTDTLTITAGSNITLTPTASSDSFVIAATDTTYSNATTSTAGLMSAADKTKLDGVATGAEVNQNAFSNVVVGSTTLAADSTTDTLTITAGSNITLTPTASSDSFVIAATDTTYSNATTSTAGLMSASDKAKLDGITESADAVSVTQNATSGNAVATVTINGTSTTLYAAEETEAIAESDIVAIFD